MGLSNDIMSQFAKLTSETKDTKTETVVYGTAKVDSGVVYVKMDGSDRYTPVITTAEVKDGERVTITIKDHTAIITGNTSNPSAGSAYKVTNSDITAANAAFDTLYASDASFKDIDAVKAEIETLAAMYANLDNVTASDVKALNAAIESLEATFAEITDLTVEDAEIANAFIQNLKVCTGNFTYLSSEILRANKADIEDLNVKKLAADFANINFANLDTAQVKQLYAASGIIEDVVMDEATVTYLIGVTIKGDLIEAGTLKAEQLVIRGTDGNYYKLNTDFSGIESVEPVPEDTVHGSVIAAKSLTAEKIRVSDLVAFGATIGGFNISGTSTDEVTGKSKPGAIYSGSKSSVDNTTRGSYLDNDGQFSFGDSVNFVKYYKVVDDDGNDVLDDFGNPIYKLLISADNITFGSSRRTAEDMADLVDRIKMGSYVDPETGETRPAIELDEEFGDDKLQLTNEDIVFSDDNGEGTKLTKNKVSTETIEQRGWVWEPRANGNYGLVWKGVVS